MYLRLNSAGREHEQAESIRGGDGRSGRKRLHTLAVQGRAWEDVHIGDTVSLDVMAPDGAGSPLTFQIMGCRSYGVDIPELSHGMTGELVLQGPHGDLLREDDVLLAE